MTAGFTEVAYQIAEASRLDQLTRADSRDLAEALAQIDPWRTLGFTAERLQGFIAAEAAHQARYAIRFEGRLAGFVCVDRDWLLGPYLRSLAVLPAYQSRKLGSAVLTWLTDEARRAARRNVWVCVSDFNRDAQRLYELNGFEKVADIADMVVTGRGEILMRKVLFR